MNSDETTDTRKKRKRKTTEIAEVRLPNEHHIHSSGILQKPRFSAF